MNTAAWISLLIAGLFEIVWAISMKYSEGFTKLWPSVVTIAAMWVRARKHNVIRLCDVLFVKGINLIIGHVTAKRLSLKQCGIDFQRAI